MWRRVLAGLVDLSSCVGLFVLLTGGLRTRHHALLPDIDLTFYGPLFLPLAACVLLRVRLQHSRVLAALERARVWLDQLPSQRATLFVYGSIALASSAHALVVYLRHFSFKTGMDLAIYANACRGGLFSTMKGDVWLLADHFEPVLLLFTPLCRAFTPALALLGVQTLSFGAGACGIYALARRQGYEVALAWLVSLLYLGFSGNVTVAYYDFHLLTLALGVVPWLWWAVAAQRHAWVFALGLLALGLKENVALSLIGFGGFLLLQPEAANRRNGRWFVAIGAVSFALIMQVVYPLFRGGEESMYFAKYYAHLGTNLDEFVTTLVTRPLYFVGSLVREPKLEYVAAVLAPFLFFPLLKPSYLLPVAPAVLVNILSNDDNILGRKYHYEAEIYPMLFAMAVIAFSASRLRPVWLSLLLVGFMAPSALGIARWSVPTHAQRQLHEQLEAHVPRDRAIAAPQRIAAHLTDRERLYMFDYWQMEEDWQSAELVVVGYHSDWMGWYGWNEFEQQKLPRMLPGLRQIYAAPADPRFRLYEVIHGEERSLAVEAVEASAPVYVQLP